jgi:uncharacterized protein (DUF1800 family)
VHLLNRAAWGPRPGDIETVLDTGLESWLEQQLHPEPIAPSSVLGQRLGQSATLHMTAGALLEAYQERIASAGHRGRPIARDVFREGLQARVLRALDSPNMLEEVLTDFWFNHFNVFIGKGLLRVLPVRYEYDAIRPHLLGNFRDLLMATAMHPAMLFYLDQWNSSARAGINENYAREVMELHTLGVNGGYTQSDVSELARVLSGFTFDRRDPGNALFRFDGRRHDAGPKVWLGAEVPGSGQAQGVWALEKLASHPSTAQHLSQRMVRYFVSDTPQPQLQADLARVFIQTRGDLRQMTRALFTHHDFWHGAALQPRLKPPMHFVLSALRAAGVRNPAETAPVGAILQSMGMPLYGCPTPDGFSPLESAWHSTEGFSQRIQWASQVATATPNADLQLVLQALGPAVQPATLQVLTQAPKPQQVALVLASPEFLRR